MTALPRDSYPDLIEKNMTSKLETQEMNT